MEAKVNLGDSQFQYIFGGLENAFTAKPPKCISGSEIIRKESNTI